MILHIVFTMFVDLKFDSKLYGDNIGRKGCSGRSKDFPQSGGAILLIGQIFPENCMKMKEIGLRAGGARIASAPLDPPMTSSATFLPGFPQCAVYSYPELLKQ